MYIFIKGKGLVTKCRHRVCLILWRKEVYPSHTQRGGQVTKTELLKVQLTPDQLQQIRTETQELTRVREQIRQAHRTEQERIALNEQYNRISQQFTMAW